MKYRYKIFNDSIEKKADGDNLIISGYANKKIVDSAGDLVYPDGVDTSGFEKNPIILFNHDMSFPIGKVTDLVIQDDGILIKAQITQSDDNKVAYIKDLIREGILKTFSIGFSVQDEQATKGINHIKKWKLHEISVVTIPMNEESEFNLVKMKKINKAMVNKTYKEFRNMIIKEIEKPKIEEEKPIDEKPKKEEFICTNPECPNYKPPETEKADEDDAFKTCLANKIPILMGEGKTKEEAIAIATSMCEEELKNNKNKSALNTQDPTPENSLMMLLQAILSSLGSIHNELRLLNKKVVVEEKPKEEVEESVEVTEPKEEADKLNENEKAKNINDFFNRLQEKESQKNRDEKNIIECESRIDRMLQKFGI
jgi:HK97 family phage prohead protease